MTSGMYRTFIVFLGAAALVLVTNETFARSGVTNGGGSHATFRPTVGRSLHHHRGNRGFWPGGYFYEPSNGEPLVDAAQPLSRDTHYTYTYDVPWDWAHRYPPAVLPSERAYIPECPTQTVTVPGARGQEHTVNIMRCY